MSDHTKAALILCGFAALILNYFKVDILNIIYLTVAFILILRYSDVNLWKPQIDYAPLVNKFHDNILVAPLLLCMYATVILAIVLIILWVLWFPVVTPMIEQGTEIIDQVVAFEIEAETWMAFAVLYIIIAATQVFRIGMDKLGMRKR